MSYNNIIASRALKAVLGSKNNLQVDERVVAMRLCFSFTLQPGTFPRTPNPYKLRPLRTGVFFYRS